MAQQIKKSLLNKGQFNTTGVGKPTGGYGKGHRLEPTPMGDDNTNQNAKKKSSQGGCF